MCAVYVTYAYCVGKAPCLRECEFMVSDGELDFKDMLSIPVN